jgi:hypothetical protein
MYAYLTITRYPKWSAWAGFLSMACFHLPFWMNEKAQFYKLLGCGKNGTFDKVPDWRQWGVLLVANSAVEVDPSLQAINYPRLYGNFISGWWEFFGCEKWTMVLQPIEGHGTWDGKEVFGSLPRNSTYNGVIAVLTRATIRLSKLKDFWAHVEPASRHLASSEGFITSLGIGEVPWIKQATFSIWENKESMKTFSYKQREHAEVIRKTRGENWYREEMFIRFRIIASIGMINQTRFPGRKLPDHNVDQMIS